MKEWSWAREEYACIHIGLKIATSMYKAVHTWHCSMYEFTYAYLRQLTDAHKLHLTFNPWIKQRSKYLLFWLVFYAYPRSQSLSSRCAFPFLSYMCLFHFWQTFATVRVAGTSVFSFGLWGFIFTIQWCALHRRWSTPPPQISYATSISSFCIHHTSSSSSTTSL